MNIDHQRRLEELDRKRAELEEVHKQLERQRVELQNAQRPVQRSTANTVITVVGILFLIGMIAIMPWLFRQITANMPGAKRMKKVAVVVEE